MATLNQILLTAWGYLSHFWYYLVAGIVVAGLLRTFVPKPKLERVFGRAGIIPILVATSIGAFTPFCACGTVAILIPLLAAGIPWAPVMSFFVSSPLMSPAAFVLTAGVLGMKIAVAKLVSAVLLGIGVGLITMYLTKRGYLNNQLRQKEEESSSCECECDKSAAMSDKEGNPSFNSTGRWLDFGRAVGRQAIFIGKYFILFIIVSAVIRVLVPTNWVMQIFGKAHAYSVPVAAILGVPLYTSGGSSILLVKSLMDMGMSSGVALAFLIAGPGTCIPVLAALVAIARKRIFYIYLGVVFLGAVILGYIFQLI
jgi:uncharacterized membrane protein YraQ (UPF0718 family)